MNTPSEGIEEVPLNVQILKVWSQEAIDNGYPNDKRKAELAALCAELTRVKGELDKKTRLSIRYNVKLSGARARAEAAELKNAELVKVVEEIKTLIGAILEDEAEAEGWGPDVTTLELLKRAQSVAKAALDIQDKR